VCSSDLPHATYQFSLVQWQTGSQVSTSNLKNGISYFSGRHEKRVENTLSIFSGRQAGWEIEGFSTHTYTHSLGRFQPLCLKMCGYKNSLLVATWQNLLLAGLFGAGLLCWLLCCFLCYGLLCRGLLCRLLLCCFCFWLCSFFG